MMIMLPEPRGQRGAASTVDSGTHCNLSIGTSSTPTAYPEPRDVPWRVPWHVPWDVPWHVPWDVPCHVPWHQWLGVPQGRPQQQRDAVGPDAMVMSATHSVTAGAPGGRGRRHQAQVGGPHLKLMNQSPFRRRH